MKPLLCRHHITRSKTVILGRQQFYAVPARSTAQVAILVLPPCYPRLKYYKSILNNFKYVLNLFETAQQDFLLDKNQIKMYAKFNLRNTVSRVPSQNNMKRKILLDVVANLITRE